MPADHEKPKPGEPEWTKEQLEAFLSAVEKHERRRRVMLVGYLACVLVLIVGQVFALFIYGTAPKGTFVGWVFLVPFAFVGSILWIFGKVAKRVK